MIAVGSSTRSVATALACLLLGLLALPLVALVVTAGGANIAEAVGDPMFTDALLLSGRTSLLALFFTVLTGTPLAWWLARTTGPVAEGVGVLVQLPIVIPPAVVGVALLAAFGRQGLAGPALSALGVTVPFTETAVVVAQVVVAAPFYVRAAAGAFVRVSPDLLIVARTLGASPAQAWWRVAVPAALPGLLAGASLCWARALGEFGATLLFAGNLQGRTQTLPLAIYTALQSDVRLAVVFSLVLAAVGAALLVALRGASAWGDDAGQGGW